jgi:CRP/FNR family transcriptional regulator, nitrogen oxide reductase regulator
MYIPVTAFLRDRQPRFFDGLDVSDVRTIMAAGTQQRFSANSVIARQGYSAGHLYLLLSGRLRRFFTTMDGQKIVLLRVTAGEIFGEAALLYKPQEYLVSSEATTNTTTLVWSRSAIRGLCTRYPRLLENALLISFDYLAGYRTAHASLICDSAPQRLARVLANLADGIGQKVQGGVELDVRNEELANEAQPPFERLATPGYARETSRQNPAPFPRPPVASQREHVRFVRDLNSFPRPKKPN